MALVVAACKEDSSSKVEEQALPVFKVHLTAPQRKPNGMAWDQGFKQRSAPDLYFCYTYNGKRSCIERKNPNRLSCNDSFSCTIPFVSLPAEEIYIQVLDFDIEDHDEVAQGECFIPDPCKFGGVTMRFDPQ